MENSFKEIENDVSELEAPEPLVRTINLLGKLKMGEFIHMKHRMRPCNLYESIEKNGFGFFERETDSGVAIFIYLKDDTATQNYIREKYEF